MLAVFNMKSALMILASISLKSPQSLRVRLVLSADRTVVYNPGRISVIEITGVPLTLDLNITAHSEVTGL